MGVKSIPPSKNLTFSSHFVYLSWPIRLFLLFENLVKHFPLDWRLLELQSAWTTVCGFLRFIFLLPHDLCGYFNPWVPMTSNEEWDHLTVPKLIGKFEMFPHLHVWSHFNSKVVWLDIWFPKLKITKWFNPHNLRLLTRTSFCKSLRMLFFTLSAFLMDKSFRWSGHYVFLENYQQIFSTRNILRTNIFHSIKFNVIYVQIRSLNDISSDSDDGSRCH